MLLFNLALFGMNGLLLLHGLSSHPSGRLRLIACFFFTILGKKYPDKALLLGLSVLPIWDIPLLLLGHPNQFLSDMILLGLTNGLYWHARKRTFDQQETQIPPVVIFFVVTATLGWVAGVASLGEIYSLIKDNLDPFMALKGTLFGMFDWNLSQSWAHPLSVVTAYTIQCLWVFTLWQWGKPFWDEKKSYQAIILGILINCFYAMGQKWFTIPKLYSLDLGGLQQNGNLLSFLAGLGLCLIFLMNQILVKKIFLSLPLIIGLILGMGRLSFLALGFVGGIRLKRRWILLSIILIPIILVPLLPLAPTPWKILVDKIINLDLKGLFFLGGREKPFLAAWALSLFRPLSGIGIDLFYQKNGLFIEAHNLILDMALGLGWPFAIFGTGLGIFLLKNSWKLSIVPFYCALVFMGDHPYSYRGILSLTTFLAMVSFWKNPRSFLPAHSFPLLFAFAFILGIPHLITPQPWTALRGQFPGDSWKGPFFQITSPDGGCLLFKASSPDDKNLKVLFAPPGELLPEYGDWTQVRQMFAKKNHTTLALHTTPTTHCLCPDDPKKQGTLFFSEKGFIPLLSKMNFSPDQRLLSYQMTELKRVPSCPG